MRSKEKLLGKYCHGADFANYLRDHNILPVQFRDHFVTIIISLEAIQPTCDVVRDSGEGISVA